MLCQEWFWGLCPIHWIAISALVGNAAVVVTAIILFLQTRRLIAPPEVRKVRTHERIAQWNDPEFVSRREGIFASLRDAKTPELIAASLSKFDNDKIYRANVVQILNFFEGIALGISDGVLDEDSARNFFKTIIVPFLDGIGHTLAHFRHVSGDVKRSYFNEFEDMAKRWA